MANKKVFTDESLATFVDEIKAYTDDAVSTKADASHTHNEYENQNAFAIVKVNGTEYDGLTANSLSDSINIVAGENMQIGVQGSNINFFATDTVYTHPTYTSKSSGLYKITIDGTGHVSDVTVVAKSDITALGIPAQDTTYTSLKNPYSLTIQGNGTTLTNGAYDGSAAKTVNITPSAIGAAASSHTHDYLPLSGGTLTGALTCNSTLKVSGTSTFGRIDASNEYLTGSLYVGGKTSTSDGKTGVAFGASGNITMQGSSEPTLNFISGTAKSAQAKIASDSSGFLNITGAGIVLPNTKPIYGKDVDGNRVEIARVGGESGYPGLIIGDSLYSNATGYTNIGSGSRVTLLNSKDRIVFERNDTSDTTYTANFRPESNGTCNLGTTGKRFKQLFAATTTISTSDEREKNNIMAIEEYPSMFSNGNVFEILFSNLIPKTYYLNLEDDAPELHIGFIAQDIVATLNEMGMSEGDVSLLHHGHWIDEETGEEKDMYGLRYEEFIALNTYMIQKCLSRFDVQQTEMNNLKQEIEDLKAMIIN